MMDDVLQQQQTTLAGSSQLHEEMQALMLRFPDAPVMAAGKFWPSRSDLVAASPRYRIASLYAQDASARMNIQVRAEDGVTMVSFYVGAMLGLQFDLAGLGEADKRAWLNAMRSAMDARDSAAVFLWTAAREERDYLVGIFHPDRPFIHLHAFSPYNHEAAVRVLYPVLESVLHWLDAQWFTS